MAAYTELKIVADMTTWSFETLGNAMIQVFQDGVPALVTDPWLVGSAYFGSWELERPLNERQIGNAAASPFVWFSHGHPDHFHLPSMSLLSRDSVMLVPDHYDAEMARSLDEMGFKYRILPNKEWVSLADGLRVLCVANENMDAILAIDAGGVLLLDKNDSPFCGEDSFFRNLVRGHARSYLLALCAYDADMINTYDAGMRRLIGPPAERKPGTVWGVARAAEYLGVSAYCVSSSQHVYTRPDSAWANDYRITWPDMQKLWTSQSVRLVGPYSVVDLSSGGVSPADSPAEAAPQTRVAATNGDDDWDASLSKEEWTDVEKFARQFETLRRWQDFVAFTVGGETRQFLIRSSARGKPQGDLIGVNFHVPRASLLDTVKYGYFDDLLIGNFMKAQLFNMELYPHFSPLVAKLGGNAKVFTGAQLLRFRAHFLRQSPLAFMRFRWQQFAQYSLMPAARRWASRLGLFDRLKRVRAKLVGSPKSL
jgi:hypothetical protein